ISAHAGSFADPAVGAVAGLTHPLELETPAQVWFERFGGFARGHRARTFAADEPEPPSGLWPYTPGAAGAGGNFAARPPVHRRRGPRPQPAGAARRRADPLRARRARAAPAPPRRRRGTGAGGLVRRRRRRDADEVVARRPPAAPAGAAQARPHRQARGDSTQ